MDMENTSAEVETTDTADATQDVSTETQNENTEAVDTETSDQTDQTQEQKLSPFAAGKEKFKIHGKEVEWDWDTTKRMAQLGYAGRRAMQERAEYEKKVNQTFLQLAQLAERDPDSAYEMLTGKKKSQTQQKQASDTSLTQDPNTTDDPRMAQILNKLQAQEQLIESLKKKEEASLVEQEAKAIESEYQDVEKSFPELSGDKYIKQYIKDFYYKELTSGNTLITLEDVAFEVVMEMREAKAQKDRAAKKTQEIRKQKAVVSTVQGSTGKSEPKFRSFEDVKKFAGVI